MPITSRGAYRASAQLSGRGCAAGGDGAARSVGLVRCWEAGRRLEAVLWHRVSIHPVAG